MMYPVGVCVDAQSISVVRKAEEIGITGARALKSESTGELVLAVDALVQTHLHCVNMRVAGDWGLKVVLLTPRNVWHRIKIQKSFRLRADGHCVIGIHRSRR